MGKKETNKPLSLTEVGTKAKLLLNDAFLSTSENNTFRSLCLRFYVSALTYLKDNLPFDVAVIKHAHYLHPGKRDLPGSLSDISNLSLKVTTILTKCLLNVFEVSSLTSCENVCDLIRHHWEQYQLGSIPQEWYIESKTDSPSRPENSSGYWNVALSQCGLQPAERPVAFKYIDFYWSKVCALRCDDGNLKYPRFFLLVRCVLSLSHKDRVPERGVSINKYH